MPREGFELRKNVVALCGTCGVHRAFHELLRNGRTVRRREGESCAPGRAEGAARHSLALFLCVHWDQFALVLHVRFFAGLFVAHPRRVLQGKCARPCVRCIRQSEMPGRREKAGSWLTWHVAPTRNWVPEHQRAVMSRSHTAPLPTLCGTKGSGRQASVWIAERACEGEDESEGERERASTLTLTLTLTHLSVSVCPELCKRERPFCTL